jgi:hypothetical protein
MQAADSHTPRKAPVHSTRALRRSIHPATIAGMLSTHVILLAVLIADVEKF